MANNLPRYSLLGSAECKKKKSTLSSGWDLMNDIATMCWKYKTFFGNYSSLLGYLNEKAEHSENFYINEIRIQDFSLRSCWIY